MSNQENSPKKPKEEFVVIGRDLYKEYPRSILETLPPEYHSMYQSHPTKRDKIILKIQESTSRQYVGGMEGSPVKNGETSF